MPRAARRELTADQWQDILRQAADLGALSVRFTGGEPLLRPDFAEIYLFARRLGLKVMLFTNGRLITPELADLFARVPPLKKIEISVYGMRPESYDAVACAPGAFAEFRRGRGALAGAAASPSWSSRCCCRPTGRDGRVRGLGRHDPRDGSAARLRRVPGSARPPRFAGQEPADRAACASRPRRAWRCWPGARTRIAEAMAQFSRRVHGPAGRPAFRLRRGRDGLRGCLRRLPDVHAAAAPGHGL